MHLIVEEVRHFLLFPVEPKTALAAVARYEAAAAAELIHGEHALVVAALTAGHGRLILERNDPVERQHRGRLVFPAFARNQRRAKGTHDAGDIRANAFARRCALKGAEHCVVIESTALHDNVLAEA